MSHNVPIFEYRPEVFKNNDGGFSAAFLGQKSYIELLRIADSFFSLNMTTSNRQLPSQQNSYMVMARSPPQDVDCLWKGVGRKIALTVDSMLYNSQYGVLVALVRMKCNFTCNEHPHIVLAKSEGVNNALVSRVVDDMHEESRKEQLYVPHRVHGKIGIIFGSGEEQITPDIKIIDNLEVRTTHNVVTRPEVVYAVERPLSPKPCSKFVSFDQFKKISRDHPLSNDDVMEITLEDKDGQGEAVPTGEIYQSEQVMKGPRGGKFVIKDGKKKYVPGNKGGGKSDVVYNVNILK